MKLQRPPASAVALNAPLFSLAVFMFWFEFSGLPEVPREWLSGLLAWLSVSIACTSFHVGTRAHLYRAGVEYWKARGAS